MDFNIDFIIFNISVKQPVKYGFLARTKVFAVANIHGSCNIMRHKLIHIFTDHISKHGKVVRIKTGNEVLNTSESSISVTENFTAKLLTHNAIQIGSVDSQLSYIFVAPRSMYTNVHERSVSITTFSL